MELSGKTFFITGGAQGLGKGIAEAALEKGAQVFFGDVNSTVGAETLKELQEKFGAKNVRFAAFDVTNHQQFKDAFTQAVSEFGHVDVLVNNAGILNETEWELQIPINFTAVVYGTQLAIEHMRTDKGGRGGRVINISSIAGLNDTKECPVYCGTKQAVRAYTSSLALQPHLAELGLEFGTLCPDSTYTPMALNLDNKKLLFFDDTYKDKMLERMMPASAVADVLIQMVQQEKLSGAVVFISNGVKTYQKMEHHEVS